MSLYLIAGLVTIMWVFAIGFYLSTSKQQLNVQADLESLKNMLDGDKSNS